MVRLKRRQQLVHPEFLALILVRRGRRQHFDDQTRRSAVAVIVVVRIAEDHQVGLAAGGVTDTQAGLGDERRAALGFPVTWRDEWGVKQVDRVRYIDWHRSEMNEWLAVSQMWITGDMYKRRTDVVLFVNGIPLVLMEFKAANRKVRAAFDDNLRDYRVVVPQLFWPNAFVILSNGSEARLGSTYASWEYFGEWPRMNEDGQRGVVGLETMLRATCTKDRLLDLIENFTAYTERPGGLVKAVARCHQFLGVNSAIEKLAEIRSTGDKRLGVFWHTQGSGKSLSMLWFSQKVLRRLPGSWTFVMVTDRKELDEQLHSEFVDSGAVPQQAGVHAESIAHLRELLAGDHRYVFTLIHKFALSKNERDGRAMMPVLSDRSDIIVITDEAHRSQYDTLALSMRAAHAADGVGS